MRIATLSVLMLALLSAGCPSDPTRVLQISTPARDISLTIAEDEDPATEGIQYTVVLSGENVGEGSEVTLSVTDATDISVFRGSALLDDEESASFVTTFEASGEYTVSASAPGFVDLMASPRVITVGLDCATTSFLAPMVPATGPVRLGPEDDTEGEACGDTFATNVTVETDAGPGSTAQLLVNGSAVMSAMISGNTFNFGSIVLGNRGSTPNSLSVVVTRGDMVSCDPVELPAEILVDCEGLSCALTAPDLSRGFLNADDDTSGDAGFQADFEVTTDLEGSGETMQLVVDGIPIEGIAVTSGDSAIASFGAVDLEEGPHAVNAICFDAAGNRTSASRASFTVDTMPCGVTIESPAEGERIIAGDDEDDDVDGVQITMAGRVSGADCEELRLHGCGAMGDVVAIDDGRFNELVTLPSMASVELCATVTDAAGNVAEQQVTVAQRTSAPELAIVTPEANQLINALGTLGADGSTGIADLDPSSGTCQANFAVNCSDVGAEVELVRSATSTVLGSATCEEMAGLPAGFRAQANFASVTLQNETTAAGYDVFARTTVDRLMGMSPSITIRPDCAAPTFSFFVPLCGSVLRPTADPFLSDVLIGNSNVGVTETTLEIINESGAVIYTATSTRAGTTNRFGAANFMSGGVLRLRVCGTDPAGNLGCTDDPEDPSDDACVVTVEDLPSVQIMSPVRNATISDSGTCPAGELRVVATSDSSDPGATATVSVGSLDPVAVMVDASGNIDACVPSEEGTVAIVVAFVDERGVGQAQVMVRIDTQPPTDVIDDLTVAVRDRRGGVMRFSWTAPEDVGGARLPRYELRCADVPITTEMEWADAMPFSVPMPTPAAPGSAETRDIGGFRVYQPLSCSVRARDLGGQLNPLGNSVEVSLEMLFSSATSETSAAKQVAALGDINGDGLGDFASIAAGIPALPMEIYFGNADGEFSGPDVTIEVGGGEFTAVAGVGDVNGDDIPDIAVGNGRESSSSGQVYILYGRDEATPWPTAATAISALADVTFEGAAREDLPSLPSFLGAGIAAVGDVNGDGLDDIAMAAALDAVYIVFGSETLREFYSLPADDPAGFRITGSAVVAPPGGLFGGSASANLLAGLGTAVGGDSRPDLAIGVPETATQPGQLYVFVAPVYSLRTGLEPIELDPVQSGLTNRPFQGGLYNLGDIDGNGFPDIGTGRFSGSLRGSFAVFAHNGTGYSAAPRIVENDLDDPADDFFGFSAGAGGHPVFGMIGDLDASGRAELLIGSAQSGTENGTADLFINQVPTSDASLPRSRLDASFSGGPQPSQVARGVGFVGDVTGDGRPDFVVGNVDAGELTVYY